MQTDEEIKKEFFEENIPDYKDGCVSMSNIVDWWLSKLHTLQEEYKKELIEKIKDYDWKEKHICPYNDGSCDCSCMIKTLEDVLTIINNTSSL